MRHTNHLFVFLAIAIFSTSLSQAEKLKSNVRRTSGLVPYPRIGRNSEMVGFSRSDRAAGLLHFPRVGRSDPATSNVNFNWYRDPENDADLQFYNVRDLKLDAGLDQDYEGFTGRSRNKNARDQWIMPERPHADHRPMQKIDEPRPLFAGLQGPRNSQLALNDYTPRLGRETEF
ncbi:CAPA peptides isoform X2 [Nomia melanderi]|uniref:CAPA peptides isoform X2 n=1 Tax=Nomia melanderi TaxID=2448451 RepID=UPI0013045EE8|nr:CAPA peptides-like isoform X2 [Nomia melanderi]